MNLESFIGASYRSIAPEVNCEDCCNLQPERTTSPFSKAPLVLYGSPGIQEYHDFGVDGPIRGMVEIESYAYVVAGENVYQINPSNVYTLVGTVANDGLPVSIVASAIEIVLVSAGVGYWISDVTMGAIASPPWTHAIDCEFLDGFFIVLDDANLPTGGQFFISQNAEVWDPLDFTTAPASNNKLIALKVDHENLFVMGSVVTQPFYNNGNADFPFVPNQSGIMMSGILAKSTVVQCDNTIFWLGRNKDGELLALRADGFNELIISPPEIVAQWMTYTTPEDAVAWCYQMEAHSMYHINFIAEQKSWRYDQSTKVWHRVAYTDPTTNTEECHRGNNHMLRFGKHLVGDRVTSQIWELSNTIYKDGVNPLIAYRIAPSPFQGNKIVFYPLFELITPGGIGTNDPDTPEENPEWMLEWSNDSGHTFGTQFRLAAGRIGEYGTRLRKVGCGSGRNRVWKVSISAAVPRCLIGAEIQDAYVGVS